MKRRIQKFAAAFLVFAFCMVMGAVPVKADETTFTQIKAKVTLEGTLPAISEKYVIQMTADDMDFPMPEGSENGVCQITIEGAGTGAFPQMIYDTPGIYTYTIIQKQGTNKSCTYDKTTYYLTVYVTNAENGNGLESTSVLYIDDINEKLDEIEFHNVYPTINPPVNPPQQSQTITKTGDNTQTMMWTGIMLICAVVLCSICYNEHKKRQTKMD